MSQSNPLTIEIENVADIAAQPDTLLIDVSQPVTYLQQHIPDALFLDYNWIVQSRQPVMGLLPDANTLVRVFSAYGITNDTHVVAYDDEGGGRACRLLWTLAACGHLNFSLINGGLHAWLDAHLPLSNDIIWPAPAVFPIEDNPEVVASKDFILQNLDNPDVKILDTRSPKEFNGEKLFAQRGGHIPGAVNYEWTEAMDKSRQLRLKPDDEILATLAEKGITPDKTIVTHCQSHHRSAHTYVLLKKLGFEKVKGYPGSWSDWGNDPSTPIEV